MRRLIKKSDQLFSDNKIVSQHPFYNSNLELRNHTVVNPLSILEEVIVELTKNYRELEKKEGKYVPYRLKKNQKLITDLYKTHDSLSFLKWYDNWVAVEANMSRLLKIDPELSGFIFRIRTKMDGEHFACLMWD
jgi:hypothetical protein